MNQERDFHRTWHSLIVREFLTGIKAVLRFLVLFYVAQSLEKERELQYVASVLPGDAEEKHG